MKLIVILRYSEEVQSSLLHMDVRKETNGKAGDTHSFTHAVQNRTRTGMTFKIREGRRKKIQTEDVFTLKPVTAGWTNIKTQQSKEEPRPRRSHDANHMTHSTRVETFALKKTERVKACLHAPQLVSDPRHQSVLKTNS